MILEFEMEEMQGSKDHRSFTIKRKGLSIGTMIIYNKDYNQIDLKTMTIKGDMIPNDPPKQKRLPGRPRKNSN